MLDRSVTITFILMRFPHEIWWPLEYALEVPFLDTLHECHFNINYNALNLNISWCDRSSVLMMELTVFKTFLHVCT